MRYLKDVWCQKVLPLVYDDSLSYYETLCKLTHKINEIIRYISNYMPFATPKKSAFLSERIYVSNDVEKSGDGTREHPFKDISEAIELLNLGLAEIRITILNSGEYHIKQACFTGVSIHITSESNGTTVYLDKGSDSGNVPFYNCHLNFNSIVDTPLKIIGSFYGDQCNYAFEHVEFENNVVMYGGYIRSENSSYKKIVLYGVTGILLNTKIINTDSKESAILLARGSNISISGYIEAENLDSTGNNNFIQIYYSTLNLNVQPEIEINNKYEYYIYGVKSIILGGIKLTEKSLMCVGQKNNFSECIMSELRSRLPVLSANTPLNFTPTDLFTIQQNNLMQNSRQVCGSLKFLLKSIPTESGYVKIGNIDSEYAPQKRIDFMGCSSSGRLSNCYLSNNGEFFFYFNSSLPWNTTETIILQPSYLINSTYFIENPV